MSNTILKISLAAVAALTGGCTPKAVTVVPLCTVYLDVGSRDTIAVNGRAFVADRNSPSVDSNFSSFRDVTGTRGNPLITLNTTGVPDTYATNETWQRAADGTPLVFRGFATPATRKIQNTLDSETDTSGSGWFVATENSVAVWSLLVNGSANNGTEVDSVSDAAATVPQFMPVGIGNQQMFACVGARSADGSVRTTSLGTIDGNTPIPSLRSAAIQDLLNGDDRSGPVKAMPSMSGPGDPIRTGAVMCAMSQVGDDLSTRALYLLGLSGGNAYLSTLSDWGAVTVTNAAGATSTFARFRSVSPWTDVATATGKQFGTVSSAALVGHSGAVSIFLYSTSDRTHYKLWHAMRFTSGSWRQTDEVFAQTGDAPNGTVYQYSIAAANCPAYGATPNSSNDPKDEMLIAMAGASNRPLDTLVIRVLHDAQTWRAGVTGIYSPWRIIPNGPLVPGSSFYFQGVSVGNRPFTDLAAP